MRSCGAHVSVLRKSLLRIIQVFVTMHTWADDSRTRYEPCWSPGLNVPLQSCGGATQSARKGMVRAGGGGITEAAPPACCAPATRYWNACAWCGGRMCSACKRLMLASAPVKKKSEKTKERKRVRARTRARVRACVSERASERRFRLASALISPGMSANTFAMTAAEVRKLYDAAGASGNGHALRYAPCRVVYCKLVSTLSLSFHTEITQTCHLQGRVLLEQRDEQVL